MIKSNTLTTIAASALTALLVAVAPAAAREVGARLAASAATSTTTIPFQVRLTSATGTPLHGLQTMAFGLYSVPSGGSALWTETWDGGNAVPVEDGVASVMLGSHSPLTQSLIATNDTLYLGVSVGGEAEMVPRIQVGSAPIAMTVPDASIGSAKLADASVVMSKLGPAVKDALGAGLDRQALINGNMDVWQRGTTVADPANKLSAYAADRWYVARSAYDGGLTASQTDGSGVPGSRYALRVQRTAGNASTTDVYLIQTIETANAALMRGRKWTLSFWARKGANYSAASGGLHYGITERPSVDESPETYGGIDQAAIATLTSGWQKFSITMNQAVQGSTNTIKVVVRFDPQGTAGVDDWYEITQVQLNAGESVAPPASLPFEVELQRSLRYFQKSYSYSLAPGSNSLLGATHAVASDGSSLAVFARFSAEMRATSPSVKFYSPAGVPAKLSDFYTGVELGPITAYGASSAGIRDVTVDGATMGRIYEVQWTADAEP